MGSPLLKSTDASKQFTNNAPGIFFEIRALSEFSCKNLNRMVDFIEKFHLIFKLPSVHV